MLFLFFHEIFRRSVTTGEATVFAASGVIFEYKYSLFDNNFVQGLKIIDSEEGVNIDDAMKYSINKVLEKFRLDIAIKEAGYWFDADGNLMGSDGQILVNNENKNVKIEIPSPYKSAWKEVLDLLDIDHEDINIIGLPREVLEPHFNEVSSIAEADAIGISFSDSRIDILGKVDHQRMIITHNPGGSNQKVEETSFDDFLSEFSGEKISFFKKK